MVLLEVGAMVVPTLLATSMDMVVFPDTTAEGLQCMDHGVQRAWVVLVVPCPQIAPRNPQVPLSNPALTVQYWP